MPVLDPVRTPRHELLRPPEPQPAAQPGDDFIHECATHPTVGGCAQAGHRGCVAYCGYVFEDGTEYADDDDPTPDCVVCAVSSGAREL